jgi:hypothetical protein
MIKMKTSIMPVIDMSCINRVLTSGVNYSTEHVLIEYIAGFTNIAELEGIIRKALF